MHKIITIAMYNVIYKEILTKKDYPENIKLKWVSDIIVNRKK